MRNLKRQLWENLGLWQHWPCITKIVHIFPGILLLLGAVPIEVLGDRWGSVTLQTCFLVDCELCWLWVGSKKVCITVRYIAVFFRYEMFLVCNGLSVGTDKRASKVWGHGKQSSDFRHANVAWLVQFLKRFIHQLGIWFGFAFGAFSVQFLQLLCIWWNSSN